MTTPSITRVRGLEELYARLEQHIALAVGYCEVPTLPFIIQACRLKPYRMLHQAPKSRLLLHKQWMDEYGNSLYLEGANRLSIVLNDLSIDRSKLISTDLYRGVAVEKISRISRSAILLMGKQEDYCLLSLLGIDDCLRTFIWWRGEWKQCSSLLLGSRLLQYLSQNLEIEGYQELEGDVLALHRSKKQSLWLTQWSPSEKFISIVKEWDLPALDFINKENNIE